MSNRQFTVDGIPTFWLPAPIPPRAVQCRERCLFLVPGEEVTPPNIGRISRCTKRDPAPNTQSSNQNVHATGDSCYCRRLADKENVQLRSLKSYRNLQCWRLGPVPITSLYLYMCMSSRIRATIPGQQGPCKFRAP